MIDALQVFVRGFEDGQRGEVIASYLTEIGFSVELKVDGDSDSLGGLIETNVVYQDGLQETDPETILRELRRRVGFDSLWLQTKEFQIANEAEYGRGDEDREQASPMKLSEPTCFGCDAPIGHLHRMHCQLECCSTCGRQLISDNCVDHSPVRSVFTGHSKIQDLQNLDQVVLSRRGKSYFLAQVDGTYELWYAHRWLDGPDDSAERYVGTYATRSEAVAAAEKFHEG